VLTPDEIRIALENVSGRALEDDKLLAVLQEVDKDNNGSVDFEEFCEMFGKM